MYRLACITSALFLAAVLAVGCSSDSDPAGTDSGTPDKGTNPQPDSGPAPDKGPTKPEPTDVLLQTVTNSLLLPTKAGEYALDLDGSGKKNQFGALLAAMKSFNLDMQPEIDDAIKGGSVLILMELFGKDLGDDDNVLVKAHMADDADDPADPANNYDGNGKFKIAADSPTDAKLPGKIVGGAIAAGPGNLIIPVPIGDTPLLVPISNTQLTGDVTANGIANGVLAGAVPQADLDSKVLPAVVTLVNGMLNDAEVTQETKDMVLQVLDADKDGKITDADMKGGLIGQALAPDVDTDGDGTADALSLGVGFTTVKAEIVE